MIHERFNRYGVVIPLLFGAGVIGLCLPAFFQEDDFGIICFLRYDYPSPAHWFDVWDMGLWRPFHLGVFWIEARAFGAYAAGYRLFHGLLYLLTIGLLYRLTLRLTESSLSALIAAVLFATTYSHWQAVLWICASSELWVGLFGLAMFLALLGEAQQPNRRWRTIAILTHIAALLAKENAVALLPIAALILAYQKSLRIFRCPVVSIGMGLPWLLSAVWHAVLAARGEAVQTGVYSAAGSHLLTNAGSYLIRLFVPWITQPSPAAALFFVVLFGVSFFALAFKRCWLSLLATGWIGLALLPYLGIDTPGYCPSRYAYLASMGWAILVAALLEPLLQRSPLIKQTAIVFVLFWALLNAGLYAGHPEKQYFLRHDAIHRRIVSELKRLNLPAADCVAVKGLEAPLTEKVPDGIRYLYALAYPPPQTVLPGNGPWDETPEFTLQWDGTRFTIVK